jgi:hypothetical protein
LTRRLFHCGLQLTLSSAVDLLKQSPHRFLAVQEVDQLSVMTLLLMPLLVRMRPGCCWREWWIVAVAVGELVDCVGGPHCCSVSACRGRRTAAPVSRRWPTISRVPAFRRIVEASSRWTACRLALVAEQAAAALVAAAAATLACRRTALVAVALHGCFFRDEPADARRR